MSHQPLRDLVIFVNDETNDFIVAKHTSHANVKVSFGYSETFVYVSNYQAASRHMASRAYIYLDELIDKYTRLRDNAKNGKYDPLDIEWSEIYQDALDTLVRLRAANWAQLGQ